MPTRVARAVGRGSPAGTGPRRRPGRAVLAGLLGCLGFLAAVWPAPWPAPWPALWPAAQAQDLDPRVHGDTVVIFDASGSMRLPTLNEYVRPRKFDFAQRVTKRFVDRFTQEVRGASLGFLAFGLTPAPGLQSPNPDVRAQATRDSCQDVTVVRPLAPVLAGMSDELRRRIDGFTMHGETPLQLTIEAAARQLTRGGSIVVVTDMENTCGGDTGGDTVCAVLQGINRTRSPADKVVIDSVFVIPAEWDVDDPAKPGVPRVVRALRDCDPVVKPQIETIASDPGIEAATDAIVSRLARLAARSGLDGPRQPASPSPDPVPPGDARTFRVIDGEGRPVTDRRFDLRLSNGDARRGQRGTVALPPGAYDIEVSFEDGPQLRIKAPSADVVVTLAP